MLRIILSLIIKLLVVYGFFYKGLNLPEVFFYNLISSILIYFELLKRIKTPNWAFCLFLIDAAIPLLSTFIFLVLASLRPIYLNIYRNKDRDVNIELEQDNLNINSINDHEVVESDFNRTMQYQEAKINRFDKSDIEDELLDSFQIQPYIDILLGTDTDTKINACIMLSKFKTANSIKLLKIALQDSEYEVRYMANNALGNIEQDLLSIVEILNDNIMTYPNETKYLLKRAQTYSQIYKLDILDKSLSKMFLKKALNDYRDLLIRIPENFSIYTSIADCYVRLEMLEEVLILAKKTKQLELNEQDKAKILFYEAEANFSLSNYNKVSDLCKEVNKSSIAWGFILERSNYWAGINE